MRSAFASAGRAAAQVRGDVAQGVEQQPVGLGDRGSPPRKSAPRTLTGDRDAGADRADDVAGVAGVDVGCRRPRTGFVPVSVPEKM